jgi:glycosyltransferase involved in cell wall biosynthesis
MTTVCFVTNEIYPLNKGGIGRMLYNIAVENSRRAAPADIHFLMVWQPDEVQAEIRTALAGLAQVWFCPLSGLRHGGWIAAYERSNDLTWHFGHAYRQSLMLYAALREYENHLGHGFDFIEFPDFGGWALASLEAKAAGIAFAGSRIAVRLHSTGGIVGAHQPFYEKNGYWTGCIQDMEYLALAKADIVVGHLAAIVDYNRAFYGFPQSWSDKAIVETPAFDLTDIEKHSEASAGARAVERDFIFSSRLQPFKQPDLFIKAALYFLQQHPTYAGKFRLISYGWDERYIESLRRLIPARAIERVLIETEVSAADRLAAIRGGIVVIPSNYESLCLFAYEASQLSSGLILNGKCLAFAGDEVWRHGENCLKFGGTAHSLAEAMAQAVPLVLPGKVISLPTAPYWESVRPVAVPSAQAMPLTVVMHSFDTADDMAAQAKKLRSQLPDGARRMFMVPEAWRASGAVAAADDCALYWHPGETVWPEDIAALTGELDGAVAFAPVGTGFEEGYLARAVTALGSDPSLAAYGAHAWLGTGEHKGIRIYAGGAPSAAVLANEILSPGAVFRLDALKALAASGRILASAEGEDWYDMLARAMALEGAVMVVEPAASIHLAGSQLRAAANGQADTTLLARHLSGPLGARPGFVPGLVLKELPALPLTEASLDLSHALRGVKQALPAPNSLEWQPVSYRMKERMLQVHPMPDERVVCLLPVKSADVADAVGVRLRHFGEGNPGVDFRLYVAETAGGKARCASAWRTIMPGETLELDLPGLGALSFDGIYLEARPAVGKDTSYAWTFVDRLWTR